MTTERGHGPVSSRLGTEATTAVDVAVPAPAEATLKKLNARL